MDQEIKQEFETLTKVIKDSFEDLESRMATKEELRLLEEKMATKEELAIVKSELAHVVNQMVTKDYLDDKMADLRGDLNVMMRKGDTKLFRLVGFLKEKEVLSDSQVQELLSMEPYPKLAL